MKKKYLDMLSNMTTPNGYKWQYCSLGGVIRVNINSGEDIAHLDELDQKLWTALSCPVDGLEFDEKTLKFVDSDHDGKIKVAEIVSMAKWITSVLKFKDDVLKGDNHICLDALNDECADGQAIIDAANTLLSTLNKDSKDISFADLKAAKDVFDAKCKVLNDEAVAKANSSIQPWGEESDSICAAIESIKQKVADYFVRCSLAAFNEPSLSSLDVSADKISAISAMDLSSCAAEIASYPLAHPNVDGVLLLKGGINPSWSTQFSVVLKAISAEYPDAKSISSAEWQAVVSKAEAYQKEKSQLVNGCSAALNEEGAKIEGAIALVEKFLHIYRDFYALLRNYVVFTDLYDTTKGNKAIFQAGKLYIDQRCCDLCLRVSSMAKHADMASLSGMYLIYCNCVSKVKNKSMDIVAVLTDGDVNGLRVGKNALFYDRNGDDWDAVITKIVDNPISIRQSFWHPYSKFWQWCNDRIAKFASEKEASVTKNLTTGAVTATEQVKSANSGATPAPKAPAFDIAKFAGIFAAIGMAIGYIGGFLASFAKGFLALGWLMPLGVIAILLLISGPSMFIAWTKLRKRDLGPVLNANGWAINAKVLVNVKFGGTLTSLAKYPKMEIYDPFADKKVSPWKRWGGIIFTLLMIAFLALYFTGNLSWIGLNFDPAALKAAFSQVTDAAQVTK